MGVTFRLLGAVEMRADDEPVDLGPARQRCVLAALLVDVGRPVPVDQLIDRVWADQPPVRVRNTLHSYLSRLRSALPGDSGGPRIEGRAGTYLLRAAPETVDLHHFRRLVADARALEDDTRAATLFEQALGLWRGEVLADLETPWAHELRELVRTERSGAELDHTDLLLRLGRHGDLLADLTVRARQDPLDERRAGQLMLALYRGGRQADALHHFDRTRQLLAEELGADPSPPLQELHRQILRGGLQLSTSAPVVASEEPVPHRFPAGPRSFVGRADQLAALARDAATGRTVQISALAGAGGIGKTWLALHWAHAHRDRFPDGRLFADLHGFSPANAPMEPPDVVRGFLDALGVDPDRLPPDPDAQAALYRSLVAGKRMLIVLDNAADADQVVPLLPGGSTCTVVVTSRRHLATLITRHGARHLQLDSLSHGEAHALLTERVGQARIDAEPRAAGELLELCGGYPLALAIMSRHAQTRPHIPLAEFATELRDLGLDALDNDDDPTVSLPAVLSWSLRSLTGEQRTVFALLGIAPGPEIGLPAAAHLAGLSPRDTGKVLRTLEEASLLARQPGGRYTMHDLIRDYATTIAERDLGIDTREAALRRVLDFYTHTAYAADGLLELRRHRIDLDPPVPGVRPQSLPDLPAAMAWFDAEHPNLIAAQGIAVAHAWHRTVWQLAWTLDTFQFRRGHRHDQISAWRAAVHAADQVADPTAQTTARRLLGRACVLLGRYEEATDHLSQALALSEQHGDAASRANAHYTLASVWDWRGDARQALEHAERALDLRRGLGDSVREADALNAVGLYNARLGEYDTARAHCEAALTLFKRLDDPDGAAQTLDSLGYIDHCSHRHEGAVRHYDEAITLYRDLGNFSEIADTLDRLGDSHTALGHHDEARAVRQGALELYRQQGRDEEAERVRRLLYGLAEGDHTNGRVG